MPFDGLMLAATCCELNGALAGARIEKIYQPEINEVHLHLSRPRERYRLLVSSHPRDARIHLASQKKENPHHPPLFCMVLRKHIEGGVISKFEQPGLERILKIYINARDELGQPLQKILFCEFMGKHSNIILVNPENNNIIDGIKRYSHEISRHREVLPGRPYIFPPSREKINPATMDENTFRNLLLESSLDTRVEKALQARLDGFSRVMTREIVYRAGLPENQLVNYCGEHEMRVLWQALSSITSSLARSEFNPTAIKNREENPVEFAAFDLTSYEGFYRRHGKASNILEDFFVSRRRLDRYYAEKQSLTTLLRREIKKLEKKISLQETSAYKSEKAEEYRICGELLTANFFRLEKGLAEITVDNFYDSQATPITIPLDPNLTPSENVQSYFKKYTKARNTRNEALKQAQKSRDELNYLHGVMHSVDQAAELKDLLEIRQELEEQGYTQTKHQKAPVKSKKEKVAESYPRKFTSSDGYVILVGRNNKQNDRLTMKIARNDDVWLHTKEIAGSHVIIKTEGHTVPERTLYQAAVLAAYYSQGRDSQNVPVDYTLKKHVKKPRGARPGYVIYEQQHTAMVTPDQELVESLAENTP